MTSIRISKKLLVYLLLILLIFCGAVYSYTNIVIKPFPFIDMRYVTSVEQFNASPGNNGLQNGINLNIGFSLNEKEDLKKYVNKLKTTKGEDLYDDIRSITLASIKLMELSKGESIRRQGDLVSEDPRYRNICSESSKVAASLAQALGYWSRVVWTNGHTVTEIYDKTYGWILVDTYANVWFKDKNGTPQSLLDVRYNYPSISAEKIVSDRDKLYQEFLRRQSVYYNNNTYVVISGDGLLEFDKKTHQLSYILKSIFNLEDIAHGVQYTGGELAKVGNMGIDIYRRMQQ